MWYLILTGVIALLSGLVLLISPEKLEWFSAVLNRTVMTIDEVAMPARKTAGALLLLAGIFILWLIYPYPDLLAFNLIVVLALFFGLLFLFYPGGLDYLCELFNRAILSGDNFVLGSRKMAGVLLIILSIYTFYEAYYNFFNLNK